MIRSKAAFDANILRWRREIATEILEGLGRYVRRVSDGIEPACHTFPVPRPKLVTISNQGMVRLSKRYCTLKAV